MVLINMQGCNKRCFFARMQFGGKERLRETKREEASQGKVYHHFSSSAGFVQMSSKSGSLTVFPKYNCFSEFWTHVSGDRDRTLSIVNSVKHK